MSWQGLLVFSPLLAMLACAAAIDLRSRRIPNALNLAIAALGIVQSFTPYATVGPLSACAGMAAGLGIGTLLFVIGALGGGDVKLLGALGTWLGGTLLLQVFLATAVVAMVLVLLQCAWRGRLGTLLRDALVVMLNLLHIRQLGVAHVRQTVQAPRALDKPLPYAVPVLIATVGLLALERGLL